MRGALIAVAVTVGLLLALNCGISKASAPIRPEQPHPDLFSCGVPDCQLYNPLSMIIRNGGRDLSYRLITMPGCSAGSVPNDLLLAADDLRNATQNVVGGPLNITRNDVSYNFTIRINCGSGQIAICGSVNIYCLGRGFPQIPDVEISDLLSTYPLITRVSILEHEALPGHALLTWNEQYCIGTETTGVCAGLPQFTSTPGWVDIMNTGPNSRHYLGDIEKERMQRTGLPFVEVVACDTSPPYWCDNRWHFANGYSLSLSPDVWYDPQGREAWTSRQAWGGWWSPIIGAWVPSGDSFFKNDQWYTAPN